MEYSKEQYEALIKEQKKKVDFYQSAVKINGVSSYKKLWGWIGLIAIIPTIASGGILDGGSGLMFGLISIASLAYWAKLTSEENNLLDKFNEAKYKLDELQSEYDELN